MLHMEKLQLNLSEEDLHRMLERYHYEAKDLSMLRHLYYAIEPVLDGWCYYETDVSYPFLDLQQQAAVLVTLGKGVDRIMEAYQESGCIEEAYMLDCIGSELLWSAYGMVQELLWESQGLWQTHMEFPGDTYPLEAIATVLDHMRMEWNKACAADGQEDFFNKIQYNEAYMLSPQKSAVYMVKADKYRPEHQAVTNHSICDNCSNVFCPNRAAWGKEKDRRWTYGYQTIFRKKDMTDDSNHK